MRRNYIITLSLIICGLVSCQNKNEDKKNELSISQVKIANIILETSTPNFVQNDFKLVYEYSNGNANQLLGINIINQKSLKFHIVTETLPCDTEYWGVAENKSGNPASEVDQDENGTSYGANVINKIENTIAIRVALDSSKVIIKYFQNDGLGTDCFPITEKIMKRVK